MSANRPGRSAARLAWLLVCWGVGVAALLLGLLWWMAPAAEAARGADEPQRRMLAAYAALLLAVVLVLLLVGHTLVFQLRRMFARREARRPTVYTDAWRESGRRTPPDAG